jgi:hypothetical protein
LLTYRDAINDILIKLIKFMNIILHEIDSIAVGIDKKDGYLNATKLCTAYNNRKGAHKQPSDWLRSKSATAYIAYLSTIRNILREDLVISKAGNTDESGTWIHPDLANDFASWLSVEYKFTVSQWVQEWRSVKASNTFPEKLVGQINKSPELAAAESATGMVDLIMSHANINPILLLVSNAQSLQRCFRNTKLRWT